MVRLYILNLKIYKSWFIQPFSQDCRLTSFAVFLILLKGAYPNPFAGLPTHFVRRLPYTSTRGLLKASTLLFRTAGYAVFLILLRGAYSKPLQKLCFCRAFPFVCFCERVHTASKRKRPDTCVSRRLCPEQESNLHYLAITRF